VQGAGLPDDFFQIKTPNLGKIWRALENVDIFYGHLENFTDIRGF
jgi:hypothetical protein